MAIGFKHGSSGVDPFNFTVVNMSSQNETVQPANPKENTIWIDTTNKFNCWAYSPEMPVRRSKNRNFVTYPPRDAVVDSEVTSVVTKNGLTFTLNTDMNSNDGGKITVNGTATEDTYYRQSYKTIEDGLFFLPPGKYFMSGCPSGGSSSTYRLGFSVVNLDAPTTGTNITYDYGDGAEIAINEASFCRISIYIKSGTKLENATFYFQIEEGTSATSYVRGNANGQVWLKPSSDSYVSFEALKRNSKGNSIVFHPAECWLFRNNYGWQDYTSRAQIYQNGAWIPLIPPAPEWDGYYYKAGDQYTDVTGGWTTEGWTSTTQNINSLAEINSDHLYVVGTKDTISVVGTENQVDLSGISTIKADINITGGSTVVLCISGTKAQSDSVVLTQNETVGTYEFSLDVSSYNGSYYIIIYAVGIYTEATITSVWGE